MDLSNFLKIKNRKKPTLVTSKPLGEIQLKRTWTHLVFLNIKPNKVELKHLVRIDFLLSSLKKNEKWIQLDFLIEIIWNPPMLAPTSFDPKRALQVEPRVMQCSYHINCNESITNHL